MERHFAYNTAVNLLQVCAWRTSCATTWHEAGLGITSGVTGLAGGQAVLGEDGVLVCAAQLTHKQVSVNRRGGCIALRRTMSLAPFNYPAVCIAKHMHG